MLPNPPRRTPFDHYRAKATTTPTLDPYRFTHQKFGLTAAEFEIEFTNDIDNLLREIDTNRHKDLLDNIPFECPLSKEDCLGLFRTNGQPTLGSLLGVYRWAADLGTSRFNFEFDLDIDDFSILDAYD